MNVKFIAEDADTSVSVTNHLGENEKEIEIDERTFTGAGLLKRVEDNDARLEIMLIKFGYDTVTYKIEAVEAMKN